MCITIPLTHGEKTIQDKLFDSHDNFIVPEHFTLGRRGEKHAQTAHIDSAFFHQTDRGDNVAFGFGHHLAFGIHHHSVIEQHVRRFIVRNPTDIFEEFLEKTKID